MIRGFKLVKDFADKEIKMPKRGTSLSAGYDFFNNSDEDFVVESGQVNTIRTYIKSYMLNDEVLKIYPRSSIGFKFATVLVNSVGIIDADYFENENNDGEIFIRFMNHGTKRLVVKPGEALAQGIFQKYLLADSDTFDGEIRKGGIGSTN